MRSPRGFTLVELMMTTAIIGLLAAIAIPNFVHYQLRSRATERAVVMRATHEALTLLFIREGRFPNDLAGGGSAINCPRNPAGAASTYRRPFAPGVGDWGRLSLNIEGNLYYSYEIVGEAAAGARWHIITAEGDLDGDGDDATLAQTYTYVNGGLVSFDEASAGGEF